MFLLPAPFVYTPIHHSLAYLLPEKEVTNISPPTQWYKRIDHNEDIPQYIKENRVKYSYMIDRDGEGAGFVDYEENIATDLL